jgi:uncharacterized protein with HEPN domain
MSKRDINLLLEDILERIEKIESYTKDIQFDAFANNGMLFDATVRNFEIIGEASINIPDDVKIRFPNIP